MKRTKLAAEIGLNDVGKEVAIMGWINKKRVFREHIFLTVRDISGIAQIVSDKSNSEIYEKFSAVKSEYVVAARGIVRARDEENVNPEMKTGAVEIEPLEFEILNECAPLPFSPADKGVNDELRLRYRYIDLRREEMTRVFTIRHKVCQATREFLSGERFLEIETPVLTKSTPEGARDYLTPSRVSPGNFYALPQSPQLFKQILMISGMDRYFQIAKCFRDEDLRADRQPEFTQIDLEASFADAEDIIDITERLVKKVFKDVRDIDIPIPFGRLTYRDAIDKYGTDKPDLRFELPLRDLTGAVSAADFPLFNGARVLALKAPGAAESFSRKQLDALTVTAKTLKARGLAALGALKKLDSETVGLIKSSLNATDKDLVVIIAGEGDAANRAAGAVRLEIAKKLDLIDRSKFSFTWVTDFPMFEYSDDDRRFYALHHPFTAPDPNDAEFLQTDPARVRANAYDLVINGFETFGGSERIYRNETQKRVFEILGFSDDETARRFGFFLEAFRYGAPPHAGIAGGLDRFVMILSGTDDIKDVIAFPKTKDAACLLTGAPGAVDKSQLDELKICNKL
jgi:aspartyl-tRNA synthetase